MWKLTIEDDEGKQTQLPLAHEEYGLGRGEANTIRLTDRNISRNHAALKKNGQGWFLKDNQSYNGTFVNGVRVVGEQLVASGDIVQLGDYRLELADEVAVAQASAPGAPAPAVPPVHQRPNRLVVVVGPQPGAEFPLDKDHFTIGRSEEATISINHSSVSRVHAELFPLGAGRFEIVDKASANGIRINGVELKRGILEAGDALELGDVRLRFVGAGKIFRADQTQTLAAVAGLSGGALGKRGGLTKLIVAGAAVGVLAILGIVLLVRGSGTTPAEVQGKHVVTKENAKQLDEALKLLDNKDVDGAHKKLLEIPEDLRPTDDPGFKKVETAWGDMKFGQVDAAPDSAKKKAILKEISTTDTLDAKQRTKANDVIREIEKNEPPPVQTADPSLRPGGPFTAAPTATATDKPSAPQVFTGGPAQGPPNEEQIRKSLEPKVWGGRGSVNEIKMLKAICSHMGDHACRNRAGALLAAKLGQ